MKKKKISMILSILPLGLLLLNPSAGTAKEIKKDYHESFDVKEGDRLNLRHGDGDVFITPWGKDVIDIKVVYRADVDFFGFGKRHDFSVDFRKSGNTVYVIGKEKTGWTAGFSSIDRYEYTYEIQAPAYMALDLKGDDGDVVIQDWREDIQCDTDDGDIHFADIEAENMDIRAEDGNLDFRNLKADLSIICDDADMEISGGNMKSCRIDMEDGDLRVTDCAGSFEIEADDGDIIFERTQAGRLDIRTEDGDIDLDLLTPENMDADLKTDDGHVRIILEKGFPASFYAWSDDGSIRCELENISHFEETSQSKSGEIHGGQNRIRIHTSDGDITIIEK